MHLVFKNSSKDAHAATSILLKWFLILKISKYPHCQKSLEVANFNASLYEERRKKVEFFCPDNFTMYH